MANQEAVSSVTTTEKQLKAVGEINESSSHVEHSDTQGPASSQSQGGTSSTIHDQDTSSILASQVSEISGAQILQNTSNPTASQAQPPAGAAHALEQSIIPDEVRGVRPAAGLESSSSAAQAEDQPDTLDRHPPQSSYAVSTNGSDLTTWPLSSVGDGTSETTSTARKVETMDDAVATATEQVVPTTKHTVPNTNPATVAYDRQADVDGVQEDAGKEHQKVSETSVQGEADPNALTVRKLNKFRRQTRTGHRPHRKEDGSKAPWDWADLHSQAIENERSLLWDDGYVPRTATDERPADPIPYKQDVYVSELSYEAIRSYRADTGLQSLVDAIKENPDLFGDWARTLPRDAYHWTETRTPSVYMTPYPDEELVDSLDPEILEQLHATAPQMHSSKALTEGEREMFAAYGAQLAELRAHFNIAARELEPDLESGIVQEARRKASKAEADLYHATISCMEDTASGFEIYGDRIAEYLEGVFTEEDIRNLRSNPERLDDIRKHCKELDLSVTWLRRVTRGLGNSLMDIRAETSGKKTQSQETRKVFDLHVLDVAKPKGTSSSLWDKRLPRTTDGVACQLQSIQETFLRGEAICERVISNLNKILSRPEDWKAIARQLPTPTEYKSLAILSSDKPLRTRTRNLLAPWESRRRRIDECVDFLSRRQLDAQAFRERCTRRSNAGLPSVDVDITAQVVEPLPASILVTATDVKWCVEAWEAEDVWLGGLAAMV